MAAEFEHLDKKFRNGLLKLVQQCSSLGINFQFEEGYVSPREQARLWRQSRSDSDIDTQIAKLDQGDAPFLAHLLSIVRSTPGIHATDILPGFTWHNWGLAYTFVVVGEHGGDLDYSSHVYKKVAELARGIGINSGYYHKPRNSGLLLLPDVKEPLGMYTIQEIDKEMEKRCRNDK